MDTTTMSPELRMQLARNENTPPELILSLARDPIPAIRAKVAERPDLPPEVIAELKLTQGLHEFWAVTRTSLYRVNDGHGGKTGPVVEKIALRSESAVHVGERFETADGELVSIASYGIALFRSRKLNKSPDDTASFTGPHTSFIVGLFMSKDEAMKCLESGDNECTSPRWRAQTEAMVNAIGKDHPIFRFSELKPVLPPLQA